MGFIQTVGFKGDGDFGSIVHSVASQFADCQWESLEEVGNQTPLHISLSLDPLVHWLISRWPLTKNNGSWCFTMMGLRSTGPT